LTGCETGIILIAIGIFLGAGGIVPQVRAAIPIPYLGNVIIRCTVGAFLIIIGALICGISL